METGSPSFRGYVYARVSSTDVDNDSESKDSYHCCCSVQYDLLLVPTVSAV